MNKHPGGFIRTNEGLGPAQKLFIFNGAKLDNQGYKNQERKDKCHGESSCNAYFFLLKERGSMGKGTHLLRQTLRHGLAPVRCVTFMGRIKTAEFNVQLPRSSHCRKGLCGSPLSIGLYSFLFRFSHYLATGVTFKGG